MKKLFGILPIVAGLVLAANNPAAEKEILAAMDAYKDAMIHNNAAVLEKLLKPIVRLLIEQRSGPAG